MFHRLFRHSATKLPVHSPAGATLEGLSDGLHAARIKVFDATGLADEVVFTLDVGAPKKACQLAPGELDRPLHRLPSTYFPLVRQNVYVLWRQMHVRGAQRSQSSLMASLRPAGHCVQFVNNRISSFPSTHSRISVLLSGFGPLAVLCNGLR